MQVNYAHLCDYATISREGKLSAMGIFRVVRPAQLPYTHPQAYLAFELELNYAEVGRPFKVRIEFVDADGEVLLRLDGDLSSEGPARVGEHPTFPQVIGIGGMQFKRYCVHNVNIFLNDNLAKQLVFHVADPKHRPQQ